MYQILIFAILLARRNLAGLEFIASKNNKLNEIDVELSESCYIWLGRKSGGHRSWENLKKFKIMWLNVWEEYRHLKSCLK